MKTVCRFTFSEGTDKSMVEAAIASAIFNAECCFGKPKVRLWAGYHMAEDSPQCIIDTSTEVGEHIAQVFTGMVIETLGDAGFKVRRIEGPVAQNSCVAGMHKDR